MRGATVVRGGQDHRRIVGEVPEDDRRLMARPATAGRGSIASTFQSLAMAPLVRRKTHTPNGDSHLSKLRS